MAIHAVTILSDTMILYRPMDIEELRLLYEAGMKSFPPRKPDQPIFYPVLNLEYANDIAKRWNAQSESASGYVARFDLANEYASQFEPHQVGAARHVEFWVPSDELLRFNEHINLPVLIVSAHFGASFKGHIPVQFGLSGKDAAAQFAALARTLDYSGMDFRCEISVNHTAVFLNYAYWTQTTFEHVGINRTDQERVLEAIRSIWTDVFPSILLPLTEIR